MTRSRRFGVGASVFALAMGFGFSDMPRAAAQDGAAAQGFDEMIVTARRRAENLQKVPVAVTAFSGETIETQNISGASDLQFFVPALALDVQGVQKSTALFTIRGAGTEDALIPMDTAVGTYFAEAPQARPIGFAKSFYDIESVQVLKGPQGTLFGRNVVGGAILVEPNKPTQERDFSLAVTALTFDTFDRGYGGDITAMINLPITDKVAVRAAGRIVRRDGYVKNITTGQELEDEENHAWRVSVKIDPTDTISSVFIHDYYEHDEDGTATIPRIRPTGAVPSDIYLTRSELGSGVFATGGALPFIGPNRADARNWGLLNNTTIELTDNLTLKNIASYREARNRDTVDFDGENTALIAATQTTEVSQWTEELQLQGKSFGDSLEWVLGGFYFTESGSELSFSAAPFIAAFFPARFPATTGGFGTNSSYAVFAQGTQQLGFIDGLSLTAGFRYTWDKREFTNVGKIGSFACRVTTDAGVPLPLTNCQFTEDASFAEPTWTVGLEYQVTDDTLLYISHRHGYRAGGFNPRGETPETRQPFDPETVNDIEVGVKSEWALNSVQFRTNLALFYSKYKEIQRQRTVILPSGTVGTVVDNAAAGKVRGGEFEFTVLPFENFELSGYVNLADGGYDDFLFGGIQRRAQNFSRSPDLQGGLTAIYTLPLVNDMGELSFQANYYRQSRTIFDAENPTLTRQPAYGLLNLRMGWADMFGTTIDTAFFVKNATGTEYFREMNALSACAFTCGGISPGEPRMFGFEAKYSLR